MIFRKLWVKLNLRILKMLTCYKVEMLLKNSRSKDWDRDKGILMDLTEDQISLWPIEISYLPFWEFLTTILMIFIFMILTIFPIFLTNILIFGKPILFYPMMKRNLLITRSLIRRIFRITSIMWDRFLRDSNCLRLISLNRLISWRIINKFNILRKK